MIESTGVYFALGDITGRKLDDRDLEHGYESEGIAAILGGLFNTFPYSTSPRTLGLCSCLVLKN